MRETPFASITKSLTSEIPEKFLKSIPDKWEKIGNVLILKLPNTLKPYQEIIGEQYAKLLNCKTVLNDIGGISGLYREPTVEIIYGSQETETIHKENGIRYLLEPQRIMFSSGNMDERIRMATISNPKEIVVDLFAGIGYFTLPIAVYSKPQRIYACEINPIAYEYLCRNISLNHVTMIVHPLFGDNQVTSPKNIADRVILGYLHETDVFLKTAFECLKNNKGILHFHDVYPNEVIPEKPLNLVRDVAKQYKRSIELLLCTLVKSYAPGITHMALDIRIW